MVPKKKSASRKKTNKNLAESRADEQASTGSVPSPKKKSSAKKKIRSKESTTKSPVSARSEADRKELNRGFAIYTDQELQRPLQPPNKDIIKILTRNPFEVFIFWNILPSTFQRSIDFFNVEKERIGLELVLEYNTEAGNPVVQKIAIHPLSQNYFCRFLNPVLNLRVTLYAVSGGRYFLLFNSGSVDLPSNKPSTVWDEEWIHPEWIEKGYLVRNAEGRYVLAEGVSIPESLPLGSSGFFGSSAGSSGTMLSSQSGKSGSLGENLS